jgi:hypothetical protein
MPARSLNRMVNLWLTAPVHAEYPDIVDEIEPIERAKAKQRQQAAGQRGKEGGRGKKNAPGKIP